MENLTELEVYSTELTTAITSLTNSSCGSDGSASSSSQSSVDTDELQRIQEKILSIASKIKATVRGPTDFLQRLASQCETLACLRWLGEFQILACIPSAGSVPIKDIADLTGAPEKQLCRIIRLTATAGFLHEPQPGHVAHTQLSSSFFLSPSYLDAAMFLSEFVAPSSLQMVQSTHHFEDSHMNRPANYSLSLPTANSFHAALLQRPKLNRQWHAYLHHIGGLHTPESVAEILTQLNWAQFSNVPNACIVEVDAVSVPTSISRCLAERYPNLRFHVQINNPKSIVTPRGSQQEEFNERIITTGRTIGAPQSVTDAQVYMLHLPVSAPAAVLTELAMHLDVLRSHNSTLIILACRLLPEPGSLAPEVEAVARTRDLTLLQLASENEMEMTDLIEIIDTVKDGMGKLVVTRRLHSNKGQVIALVVKYQSRLSAS